MSFVPFHPNHPTAVLYAYQTLGQFQIRLMSLAPGDESDEIHIRLNHVDLKTDPDVDYEALSYAWGTSEPTQRIIVDSDDGSSGFIPVRDNLADALRRIRDTSTTKTLWADALCMNQSNNDEKSHQVPFMAEIYRRATRVIVWLGTERDDSASAMEMMRNLGENMKITWMKNDVTFFDTFDQHWDVVFDSSSLSTSMETLLERDWFERLWVHQEVHLSRRATVLCGSSEVEWVTFAQAAFWIISTTGVQQVDPIFLFNLPAPGISWPNLRTAIARKKCSDPRDRVYGMLAMMEDNDTHPLPVDYGLSVSEVYTAAAKHSIQTSTNLGLFDSCELTSNRLDKLPSWVPDWSTSPTVANLFELAMAKATSGTRPFVDFHGSRSMRLAGVMSSRLRAVVPLGRTTDEATSAIVHILQTVRIDEKFPDGELCFGDALLCAIIGGNYSHSSSHPRLYHPNRETCRGIVQHLLSSAAGTTSDRLTQADWLNLMNKGDRFWKGRALFLTEDGYIGLGHQEAVRGDSLFFPLGSRLPLLVRRSRESQRTFNEWLVVSTCYVSGLMSGEILYGPLPASHCMVMTIEEKGYRMSFHRMDSDSKVSNKPDLEFEKRSKKAFGVDEKLLTPELLRDKGVPVEWINLV